MKKKLRLLFCLCALAIAFGSAPMGSARQSVPRVGGFKPAKTDDQQVVAAARFAVEAIAKKEQESITLVSIESAEYKVVAGMIFSLCVKVEIEGAEENVTTNLKAEVFRSLQKQYQLRSYEVAECGGEEQGR